MHVTFIFYNQQINESIRNFGTHKRAEREMEREREKKKRKRERVSAASSRTIKARTFCSSYNLKVHPCVVSQKKNSSNYFAENLSQPAR